MANLTLTGFSTYRSNHRIFILTLQTKISHASVNIKFKTDKDAIDRNRWNKLIKIDDDQDGGWANVSSGTC